jgi:hypothetical protein
LANNFGSRRSGHDGAIDFFGLHSINTHEADSFLATCRETEVPHFKRRDFCTNGYCFFTSLPYKRLGSPSNRPSAYFQGKGQPKSSRRRRAPWEFLWKEAPSLAGLWTERLPLEKTFPRRRADSFGKLAIAA